ncbi:MAG: hypothetical protein M3154_10580, partial [Candidatus Eremiobacteraeota bacterium]|nr:hypothetical protein [Candidatus Eremiobacteraeota bacterium]
LNSYNYTIGDPGFVQHDLDRYTSVTIADVQRVARKYLTAPKVVLTIVPEGKRELMVSAPVTGGSR